MQQVATTRFDIAAQGSQQAVERNSAGNSEFSQIFEQNQKAQNAAVSNNSQSKPPVASSSNSHKSDANNASRDRTQQNEPASDQANNQKTTLDKNTAAESNSSAAHASSANQTQKKHSDSSKQSSDDKKEILIVDPDKQSVIEQGQSDTLSLESELQELNDGNHNQWVNLLNQLLIKQENSGTEFDDGGPAPDPYAVDVGLVLENVGDNDLQAQDLQGELASQLKSKHLEEEIIITLPDQPGLEVSELDTGSQYMSFLEDIDSNQEAFDNIAPLLEQLDNSEVQELISNDENLQNLLTEFLSSQEDSSSAEGEVIDLSEEIDLSAELELSAENQALLANLILGQTSQDRDHGSSQNVVKDNVSDANQSAAIANDSAKLLAQLEAMLTSNEEKLAAMESLVARLQSHPSSESGNAEFIASLKAGIKEFKDQMKAGREPGIDLQALVADVMTHSENNVSGRVLQEQLTSSLQQITSVLSLSQNIDAADRDAMMNAAQSALRTQSEVAANVLESNRQSQLLQTQADKAINIAKPEAAQQLAKQVQVMVNQKTMVAEIRLDPPDLGSMKINISMQGDTASVNIVVQSQQARDMLEQNSPKLRELLEAQGIELGQSSVQEEGPGERDTQESQYASSSNESSHDDLESEQQPELMQRVNIARPDGIDYFA